jgi:hypothetical protein
MVSYDYTYFTFTRSCTLCICLCRRFGWALDKQLLYREDIYVPPWQLSVESAARDSPAKCARLFSPVVRIVTPHPLTRRRVCSPLLWFRGGGYTLTLTAWEGVGGSQFRQWDRHYGTLGTYLYTVCTLCSPAWGRDTIHRQNAYMCEILIDRQFFAHFVRIQVTELMEGSLEDEAA